jgi:hypothetical protein
VIREAEVSQRLVKISYAHEDGTTSFGLYLVLNASVHHFSAKRIWSKEELDEMDRQVEEEAEAVRKEYEEFQAKKEALRQAKEEKREADLAAWRYNIWYRRLWRKLRA